MTTTAAFWGGPGDGATQAVTAMPVWYPVFRTHPHLHPDPGRPGDTATTEVVWYRRVMQTTGKVWYQYDQWGPPC